ncbi:MAG: class I SAM-dependent methyltransferase [Anaerolineae bacterium]|nr:class I SAM-dependent methyltransferase [Anaerolineae bacterium]
MQTDTEILQQYKLLEARFDRAAQMYDATYGPPDDSGHGNPLVGWLREQHVAVLREVLPEGASVLDIGCGTGEESIALAKAGYSVLGIDISPAMVRQAQTKAAVYGIRRGMSCRALAAGRLETLDERGPFQGAFASLGTLNTEPDLPGVARGLHGLLEPGAPFVVTVMSRHCLYEILHNLRRFQPGRTLRRHSGWRENRAGAGGVVAPVRFYSPRAFAAPFLDYFTVESVRAFPLWLPPVHLHDLFRSDPERYRRRLRWEQRMQSWPGFRAWGDHFLMILRHAG